MREIIFRGKNATDNNWVYGFFTNRYVTSDTITMPPMEISTIVIESGEHIVIDHKTVGQYTGMKDKNGIRVFEGDIIITDNKWKNQGYSVVKYSDENTAFVLECQHSGEMLGEPFGMNYFSNNIEVIGNIYDNPELLEGDKT